MQVARIDARGRTTIPKFFREVADLREGDAIAFEIEGDRLVVRKAASGQAGVDAGLDAGRSPQHVTECM